MAVEWLTPKGSAAAAAASAAKVFLLRLLGGRSRFRGTSGVAAGSLTLFWLPYGRPRLHPLGPSVAPAPAPLVAPKVDIEVAGGEAETTIWQGEGVEMLGSEENPRELRDLKAGETRKAEPV
jgi:hypothetical protein